MKEIILTGRLIEFTLYKENKALGCIFQNKAHF